ncbi:MAG: hypothetical protein IT582_01400 [Opitutaceae bacterium]|nr:hypothetical protein [Opitutaceae bacterium]
MRPRFTATVGLLLMAATAACSTPPSAITTDVAGWHGPVPGGTIHQATVNEASGLAPSRRAENLLWINNDSGGEPVLYAVNTDGTYRGAVRINGAVNYDWEDVASFAIDGRAYLLAADVGDNNATRAECVLYIIAEPDPAELKPDAELAVDPVRVIRYVYPGGPRDCENVAVDATERAIYVVSKRTKPPIAYRLPLEAATAVAPVTAERVGEVNGIAEPAGPLALLSVPWGKWRASPCSLDISADGRRAVLLTYGEPYLYERRDGETWAAAFARDGLQLGSHGLPQAEGACFSPDGRVIYVVTEGTPAPLLTYTLTQ